MKYGLSANSEKMGKHVCKLPKEGQTRDYYILSTEWDEENTQMTVIDGSEVWIGKIDPALITDLSAALHKTKDDYIRELKSALMDSKGNFTFVIENEKFVVKKIDLKSKIKIKYFTIQMQKISPVPIYMSLVSELIDQDKTNRSEMLRLSQEMKDLKTEREEFVVRLQQYAEHKVSMETLYFSKFCQILNTKKEKIVHLESLLAAGENLTSEHNEENVDSTIEQSKCKNSAVTKCVNQKNHTSKRKFPKNISGLKSKCQNIEAKPSTSKMDIDWDSDHYDSETDIDTDDESAIKVNNKNIVPSMVKPIEDQSMEILPKRCSSNISLPRRGHSPDKNKDAASSGSSPQPKVEYEDEFNSQSLLDMF